MITNITYAKRIRESGGMLLVSIPKEVVDEMHLVERELVEIHITKKVDYEQTQAGVLQTDQV